MPPLQDYYECNPISVCKLLTVTFFGLVILPPKLIITISAVLCAFPFKDFQHPLLSAFLLIVLYSCNNSFTGKFLEISKDVTGIIIFCRNNKMNMIAHNAPAIQYQSFFFGQCLMLSSKISLYSFLVNTSIHSTTAKETK